MKFTTVIVGAASVFRVSATAGIGLPFCLAACSPLLINPIAYAACATGCTAAAVPEEESKASPRFLPDGSVVFEKESDQCAGVCKQLVADRLAYSACLAGCAGATEGAKK
ncbi:hypothetical protein FZEAL_1014 [Fusarium zealandicum]|uniref:Uncharacterized protein n=1 Tax=Fusarium zealandicum TaxID=1053134 RepID=A0A8H4XP76_9HYPO|nr:hypothetical protein FZEAL_1014 [Fusarium zealandicum]